MNTSNILTIGVSTRALFDLEAENQIFESQGHIAYVDYMVSHENELIKKGPAFNLIKAFLDLNKPGMQPVCEVIIMSKNSANSSLRIFNSIAKYGLNISRAALTTGLPIAPYLKAYDVDLYLSANEGDVCEALKSGVAAAKILCDSNTPATPINQIRIAFDGDCVLFSDEAEKIYQTKGLEAFDEHEKEKAFTPLKKGPFANFLSAISLLQNTINETGNTPIRTALITARSAPSHERVIRTLRSWNVRIDEAHFLGGRDKTPILKAYGAHIFFDDNEENLRLASTVVLSAKVPNFLKVV